VLSQSWPVCLHGGLKVAYRELITRFAIKTIYTLLVYLVFEMLGICSKVLNS